MGRFQAHISRERDQWAGEVGSKQHHNSGDHDEKLFWHTGGRLQIGSRVNHCADRLLQDASQGIKEGDGLG